MNHDGDPGVSPHLSQHVAASFIARGRLMNWFPLKTRRCRSALSSSGTRTTSKRWDCSRWMCLRLGMLSAIRRAFNLINEFGGASAVAGELNLATVPGEDRRCTTYLPPPDTVGGLSNRMRAQHGPCCHASGAPNYYDLVESKWPSCVPVHSRARWCILTCVARNNERPLSYPSKDVRAVLNAPWAVPISRSRLCNSPSWRAGIFRRGEAASPTARDGGLEAQGRLRAFFRSNWYRRYAWKRGYAESFAQQINFIRYWVPAEYGFRNLNSASFRTVIYTFRVG